jgi:putative ABC transport system ATP-binding protein
MGFVFQSFQLLPSLTALENVMLPLQLKAQPNAKELSFEALNKVGLSERVQHYPKQLSGGEQQRVAIARAFATSPAILFADEPTGNLDKATGQVIIELLFKMNVEAGTTLVLVTHDIDLANRCQRQLKLENGVLTELVDLVVA